MPFECGIQAFDKLESSQQLALLAEVGTALLDENSPPPELTAIREATVAAIIKTIRLGIEFEMDGGADCDPPIRGWRSMVIAVYSESGDDVDLPPASSTDMGEWECLVEALGDRILWDRDWELEDLIADKGPAHSGFLKQMMRISEDYFTDIAPCPAEDELDAIRARLKSITDSPA